MRREPGKALVAAGLSANAMGGTALTLLAMLAVVVALIVGSAFFIPLAVAILLWNLLIALVEGFQRISIAGYRMPAALALLMGCGTAFLGLFLIAYILLGQSDALNAAWPRYASRITTIIGDLTDWLGPERSDKVKQLLGEVDLRAWAMGFVATTGSFLGYSLQVIVYIAFLLVERGYMAAKVRALFEDRKKADDAILIIQRVSDKIRRYVWIKTVVSALTGVASYAILRAFGVDFAEVWGALAFFLNFIPYVGTYVAVIAPVLVAMVQFDTAMPAILVLLSLMAVQTVFGSILDPMWMGKSLNVSPFAIVVALIFWGMLWGIVGMFLSVPILIVIIVVCAGVPSWRWVAVLLSRSGEITIE